MGGCCKCGKERTCGRGFLEVWQGKDLAGDFSDVWQAKDLRKMEKGKWKLATDERGPDRKGSGDTVGDSRTKP